MSTYTTGAVTVTNGSVVVTGVGTGFVVAGLARGNLFMIRNQGVAYFIAAVDSATQMRLTAPYAGTTGSGKRYTVALDFTERLELPLMYPGDVDTATIYSRAMAILDDAYGGAYKYPARMATTAALAANSRASGLTLIANAVGAIGTIDGVTPVLGDRILVKNEADASKNGIYAWTDLGDTSASWELTRATDFDTDGEVVDGDSVPIQEGTTNFDTSWRLVTDGPITLDVTNLTFTQMAAGPTGPTGPQGAGAGIAFTFSTTTSMVDPGAGTMRFNNATPASVTAIALDDLTADAADVSAWITAFDDSTSTVDGTLYVIKNNDASVVAIFSITGLTDNAGWTELAVTHVASTGAFANGATMRLLFARTGDKGDTGATGATGSAGSTGATGTQGDAAGVQFTFSTSTTMAEPGAGALRFNNAIPASVTEIAVDDLSADTADISTWLLSFDDSTSAVKGTLHVIGENDASIIAIYQITNITNVSGGWKQLAVAYVSGAGSFTNGLAVRLLYAPNGDKGDTGTTGSTGSTGATGADGVHAGIKWLFDSTTTMADPGAGDVRLNHATLASVTAATFSANNAESGNPDVSDFLVTWDDSTNTLKGHLLFVKIGAPQNFALYSISGSITDNTTWLQITLTHIASSGSLSNTDPLSVQFIRIGDKGADGAGTGDALVANPLSQFAATTSAQLAGVISDETGTDKVVFNTSPTLVTPILGTPTSGTLTNCTGLPQAGVTGLTTADSPQFAGVNIGHASDTTLARVSAGVVAVENKQIAVLSATQTFSAAQTGSITALTDAANIATDLALNNFFSVTLAGNRTLNNPTNIVAGQSGSIFITQDATGSRTLAFGTYWDFAGGTVSTLSTAANSVDRLDYLVRTTTSIHCVLTKAVS